MRICVQSEKRGKQINCTMHSGDTTLLQLVVFSAFVFVLYLIYTCWNFFFRDERSYDSHTGGFTVYLNVPEWRHGMARLDLHGFETLNAALERLEEYLEWCRGIKSIRSVIVITGRGLHTEGYRHALRSVVQSKLCSNGYSFESHDGGFTVYM